MSRRTAEADLGFIYDSDQGPNRRFVVTNLSGEPQPLCNNVGLAEGYPRKDLFGRMLGRLRAVPAFSPASG